jgi:hypothetical protein
VNVTLIALKGYSNLNVFPIKIKVFRLEKPERFSKAKGFGKIGEDYG